jgi:FixJ family two-component response regulator
MGAEETYRALHTTYPKLPILLCSGHTREAVANDLLSDGAAGFLQKPFTRSDLQKAIEAALSPPEA